MRILHVRAEETEQRVQCIKNVLAEYSIDYPYDEWVIEEYDDYNLNFLNIEVRNETIVEPLVSDLSACGCKVKVFTERNFPGRQFWRTLH
jgi:hypothetical protein